jgi:hypothetical protein
MKIKMTVDEALEFADVWTNGTTFYESSMGWRVVCMLLAEEVRLNRRGQCVCIKCGLRQGEAHSGECNF